MTFRPFDFTRYRLQKAGEAGLLCFGDEHWLAQMEAHEQRLKADPAYRREIVVLLVNELAGLAVAPQVPDDPEASDDHRVHVRDRILDLLKLDAPVAPPCS